MKEYCIDEEENEVVGQIGEYGEYFGHEFDDYDWEFEDSDKE